MITHKCRILLHLCRTHVWPFAGHISFLSHTYTDYCILYCVFNLGIDVWRSTSAYGAHIQEDKEAERQCTIQLATSAHSIYFTSDELKIICLLQGATELEVYRVYDGQKTAHVVIGDGIIEVAPSKRAPHLLCVTTPNKMMILDSSDLSTLTTTTISGAHVDWEEDSDSLVAVTVDGKISLLEFAEDGKAIEKKVQFELFHVEFSYKVLKVHSISSDNFLVCLSNESDSEVFPFFGHIVPDGDLEWSTGLSFMRLNEVDDQLIFSCFYQDLDALVLACNQYESVEIYQLSRKESGIQRWMHFNLDSNAFGLPGSDPLRGLVLDLTDSSNAPVVVALTEESLIVRSFANGTAEWKGLRRIINVPIPSKLTSSASEPSQRAPPRVSSPESQQSTTAEQTEQEATSDTSSNDEADTSSHAPQSSQDTTSSSTTTTETISAQEEEKPTSPAPQTMTAPSPWGSATTSAFGSGFAKAAPGTRTLASTAQPLTSWGTYKPGAMPGGAKPTFSAFAAPASQPNAPEFFGGGGTGLSALSASATGGTPKQASGSFGFAGFGNGKPFGAPTAAAAAKTSSPLGTPSPSTLSSYTVPSAESPSTASEDSKRQAALDAKLLGPPPGAVSSASDSAKLQSAKDARLLGPIPGVFKPTASLATPIAAKPSASLPSSLVPQVASPLTAGAPKSMSGVGFGAPTTSEVAPPVTVAPMESKKAVELAMESPNFGDESFSGSEHEDIESGSDSMESSSSEEEDEENAIKGIQELQVVRKHAAPLLKQPTAPFSPLANNQTPSVPGLQTNVASPKANGFGPVKPVSQTTGIVVPSPQLNRPSAPSISPSAPVSKELLGVSGADSKLDSGKPNKGAAAIPRDSSPSDSSSTTTTTTTKDVSAPLPSSQSSISSTASTDRIKSSGNDKSASGSDVSSLFSMLLEANAKQVAARQEYSSQLESLVKSVTEGNAKLSEPQLFQLGDDLDARLKALDDWSTALKRNLQQSKNLLSEVDGFGFLLEQASFIWNTGQLDSPDLQDEEMQKRAQLRGNLLNIERQRASLKLKRSEVEHYLHKFSSTSHQQRQPAQSVRSTHNASSLYGSPGGYGGADSRIPAHLLPVQPSASPNASSPAGRTHAAPPPSSSSAPSSSAWSPSRNKPTLTQQVVLQSRKLQELSSMVKQLESQLRALNFAATTRPAAAADSTTATSLTPTAVERTTLENYAPETWNPKAIQQVGKQAKWVQLEQPLWINSGGASSSASAHGGAVVVSTSSASNLAIGSFGAKPLTTTQTYEVGPVTTSTATMRRSGSKGSLSRTRQDNQIVGVGSSVGSGGSSSVGILRSTLRSSQIASLKKTKSKSSHGSLHSDDAFSDFEEDEEESPSNSDSESVVELGNYSFGIKKRTIKPLPVPIATTTATPTSATSTTSTAASPHLASTGSTSSFGTRVPLSAPSTAQKPVDSTAKPPPAPLSPPFQPAKPSAAAAAPPPLDLNAPVASAKTTAPAATAKLSSAATPSAPTSAPQTAATPQTAAATAKVSPSAPAVGPKFSALPKLAAAVTPSATSAVPSSAIPSSVPSTASAAQLGAVKAIGPPSTAAPQPTLGKFTGFAKPSAAAPAQPSTAAATTTTITTIVAAKPSGMTWPKPVVAKPVAASVAAPMPADEPSSSEEGELSTETPQMSTPREQEEVETPTTPTTALIAAPAKLAAQPGAVAVVGMQPRPTFTGLPKPGAAAVAKAPVTAEQPPTATVAAPAKIAPQAAAAKQMFVPGSWSKGPAATAPQTAPATAAAAQQQPPAAASPAKQPATPSTAAAAPKGIFGFGAPAKGFDAAASPVTQPATLATAQIAAAQSPSSAAATQQPPQQQLQQPQQPTAKQTGWAGSGFGAKATGFGGQAPQQPPQQPQQQQQPTTSQAAPTSSFGTAAGFASGGGFGQQQQVAKQAGGFGGTQTGFQQQQAGAAAPGAGWMQRGQVAKPTTAAAPAAAPPDSTPTSSFGSGFAKAGAGGSGWAQTGFGHSFAGGAQAAQQQQQQPPGAGGGFGQRAQLGAASSFAAAATTAKPTGGLPASFGSGFSGKGTGGGFSAHASPSGGWGAQAQNNPGAAGAGNFSSARR